MSRSTAWLSKWIYILAASLYCLAVSLRTWLYYQSSPHLGRALVFLLIWLLLLVTEPLISRRWHAYFPVYLLTQTLLVFAMLLLPETPDFMAALLGILSMQVMMRLPTDRAWVGAAWIGLCAIAMGVLMWPEFEFQAIALALIYTVGNIFLAAYTHTTRQNQAALLHNQALATELENANQRLEETSARLERLSAERERNRLARELHDSVTQTVFSMNLTSQSAALLLRRDPSLVSERGRVSDLLARLSSLASSALAEMQVLIAELKPDQPAGVPENLPAALRRLQADHRFSDGLEISLSVEGGGAVSAVEQAGLYRIAQEALTNIHKHAQSPHAEIRLHLDEPQWLEIIDHGQGFDLQQAGHHDGLGLSSMRERAAEIGWDFIVTSSPGAGTRVRVEKIDSGGD